eukprot:GILK01006384.1.p1 GENE.GILK01006384.1~~GILK01006384.1.p1  ORF type:complete len:701 (+),score=146.40 GILK01006384.1:62-2164(+)
MTQLARVPEVKEDDAELRISRISDRHPVRTELLLHQHHKKPIRQKTRSFSRDIDSTPEDELAHLEDEAEMLRKKIEQVKHEKVEMDALRKSLQNRIKKKYAMKSIQKGRKERDQLLPEQQIAVLEERFDKILVKFNSTAHAISSKKTEVEKLRHDVLFYNRVRDRIEQDLKLKKERVKLHLEDIAAANQAREDAEAALQGVIRHQKEEQKLYQEELNQMLTLVDVKRKEKEQAIQEELEEVFSFDNVQVKKRNTPAQSESYRRRAIIFPGDDRRGGVIPPQDVVSKAIWNIAQQKARLRMSVERVTDLEQSFQKVLEITKAKSVEEVTAMLVENENRNFSLLTHVTELQSDIAKSERAILDLESSLSRFTSNQLSATQKFHSFEKEQQTRAGKYERKVEAYVQRNRETEAKLDAMLTTAINLMKSMGLESEVNSDATPMELPTYLGAVESRICSLVAAYKYLLLDKTDLEHIEDLDLSIFSNIQPPGFIDTSSVNHPGNHPVNHPSTIRSRGPRSVTSSPSISKRHLTVDTTCAGGQAAPSQTTPSPHAGNNTSRGSSGKDGVNAFKWLGSPSSASLGGMSMPTPQNRSKHIPASQQSRNVVRYQGSVVKPPTMVKRKTKSGAPIDSDGSEEERDDNLVPLTARQLRKSRGPEATHLVSVSSSMEPPLPSTLKPCNVPSAAQLESDVNQTAVMLAECEVK